MKAATWLGTVIAVSAALLTACGDDDTGGGTSASATSGGGGSTATGTGGGSGTTVNGCSDALAQDKTGQAEVTVTVSALTWSPSCFKVDAGTKVTFNTDFTMHPLRGGTVDGTTATPDSASPIKATDTGMTASFTLASAGTYGFYCNFHYLSGMTGAVIVQ